MPHRKTTTRLRLMLVAEIEESFDDDEHPSLGGIPYTDTTGEDVSHVTAAAGLRKCGPVDAAPKARSKAAR